MIFFIPILLIIFCWHFWDGVVIYLFFFFLKNKFLQLVWENIFNYLKIYLKTKFWNMYNLGNFILYNHKMWYFIHAENFNLREEYYPEYIFKFYNWGFLDNFGTVRQVQMTSSMIFFRNRYIICKWQMKDLGEGRKIFSLSVVISQPFELGSCLCWSWKPSKILELLSRGKLFHYQFENSRHVLISLLYHLTVE